MPGANHVPRRIDGGNGGTEQQFDLQLAVAGLAEHLLRGWRLPGREGDLGQRRAMVGEMRLGGEQQNASLRALGPQGFHRRGAGQATADDDEINVPGHVPVSVVSSAVSVGAVSGMPVTRRSRPLWRPCWAATASPGR